MVEDRIYSKAEAAEYLRISMATLDRLVAAKKIAFTKLGDEKSCRVIFELSDLKAFLNREKKWTIRDSSTAIRALASAEGKKRNLFYDQTGFADLIAKLKKNIQALEWELENATWLEDEIVKQIQILLGNLQALLDVCEVESDLSIDLAMRLFGREVELWRCEILPNLRLNKKFLDIGKGKAVELLAVAGHSFERMGSGFRSAMPHTIRVAGERYEISDRVWTPIPALDPGDETTLFAARELFKIRIAAKGAKPVSEREKQEAADKAIVAADENKLRLEAELLTGEL